MSGPIFIGGASRSGKTLLRWILSSHPRIVITRRTEMWTRFAGRYGDLGDSERLERCLAAMLARPQIAALEPDLERLRRDLAAGEPTYARLFALVHEQVAERAGKPRWGDQTPSLERVADHVMTAYADARFLHLIRDPRDAYAALLERRSRRAGTVGRWAAAWSASAVLGAGNVERYAGAYVVVRYEDLVTEPERTVRTICDALGERFEPAMLRMDGVARYDAVRASSPDGAPITSAFVGSFHGTVPPADLGYLQSAVDDAMARWGYEPVPVQLTLRQRMLFAATWAARRSGARREPAVLPGPSPSMAPVGNGR